MLVGVCMSTKTASALPITFSGSQGDLAASVSFNSCGSNLCVSLANTSTNDVLVPADVLTGVYFESTTPLLLTRLSATVALGSTVYFGPTDPGGVVGGEWGYASGQSPMNYVIASSGYLGNGNLFPGNDLQPPISLDGLQYGLTSAGDNLATGNAPVTGTQALIKNRVDFVLGGLPQGYDPSTQITAVRFQYGTTLPEPHFDGTPSNDSGVPEPMTFVLMGAGLVGIAALRRRKS